MKNKKIKIAAEFICYATVITILADLVYQNVSASITVGTNERNSELASNARADAKRGMIISGDLKEFNGWPNVVSAVVPGNKTIYAKYANSDTLGNQKSLMLFYDQHTRVTIDILDQPGHAIDFTAEGAFPDVAGVAKDAALLLTSRSFIDHAVPYLEPSQREILYLQSEDFAAGIQRQLTLPVPGKKKADGSKASTSFVPDVAFTLRDGKSISAFVLSLSGKPCLAGVYANYSDGTGFSIEDPSILYAEKLSTRLEIKAHGLFPSWGTIVQQAQEILGPTRFFKNNPGISDENVVIEARDFASRLPGLKICHNAAP